MVIHWELCKKLTFDHMNQWYRHNPESIQENETHKVLWDFEIQTDHVIAARRPSFVIVNGKKRENHRVKLKESEKKDKDLGLAKGLKNYRIQK